MSFLAEEVAPALLRPGVNSMRSAARALLALGLSILVFLPVIPSMPSAMLDPSWRMALNEAWARGFDFARDMIFTYGPYAFVSTQQYHPDTYAVLVACSLFLGTVQFLLLRRIGLDSKGTFRAPFVLLCLLASGYTSSPDVRFLCYSYLFLVAAVGPSDTGADVGRSPLDGEALVLNLAAFSLGLVCLVKATFAVHIGAMGALAVVALYARGRRSLAAGILASFVSGLAFFWLAAGQPLADLPRFFFIQGQVAAGYGEAMSAGDSLLPPALFLASAVPLAIVAKRKLSEPTVGGCALVIGMALTLLLAFKEGFVREDGWHVMIAGEVLFILPQCWPTEGSDLWRKVQIGTAALAVLAFIVMFPYALDLPGKTASLDELIHCSDRGPVVCPSQPGWLRKTYDLSLGRIRAQEPLPKLQGTVDIYTVRQALAIANGYRWDPRPVAQSYSAYTPALAQMNADHLVGKKAPDNVFFALEPTDGRLPSLTDGPSWPILLTRYEVTWLGIPAGSSGVAPIALLQRKPDALRTGVSRTPLLAGTAALGQIVALPAGDRILYAKIDIRPSVYGRFEEVLLKGSELYINLLFPGGRQERYRFVPGMARAGFIISPAVTDATQFVALRDLKVGRGLSTRKPLAFWLSCPPSGRLMWSRAAAFDIRALREMQN